MADDFYPFVDSGDPAPDNVHLDPQARQDLGEPAASTDATSESVNYATRIAIYDDMLSTPRVIVIEPKPVRTYLEEITNTVYRSMKEQGGTISLMVIREIVENFIHAHFVEPIISILDGGNTIRFADQGPGIEDKERAFEFGVTSANREQKRYIRGTGAGFPMVQQYLENAGGAISIEDNLNKGTVVTVSVDQVRVVEIERSESRGAAVRGGIREAQQAWSGAAPAPQQPLHAGEPQPPQTVQPTQVAPQAYPYPSQQQYPQQQMGYPAYPVYPQQGAMPGYGFPQPVQQFSTGQGYYGMPQTPYGMQAGQPPVPQGQAAGPIVSDRGRQALAYISSTGSGGPTDLAAAFGSSTPTWSRELEALAEAGLVIKRGQKRVLTEMGRLWLSQNGQRDNEGA